MLDQTNQDLIVQRACHEAFLTGECQRRSEEEKTAPHVLMRPRVFLDTPGHWCCMYGDCLGDSPAGYGASPREACSDFDRRWNWSQAQIDKHDAETIAKAEGR